MQVGDADMTHKTLKLPNTRLEEKCQMYFPYWTTFISWKVEIPVALMNDAMS